MGLFIGHSSVMAASKYRWDYSTLYFDLDVDFSNVIMVIICVNIDAFVCISLG